MPLVFPSVDHVQLRNPPLREVICQVRFPPILKIVEEPPVSFQEAIREHFPNLQIRQEFHVPLTLGQPAGPVDRKPQEHHFFDKDGVRKVSLGLNFYAISTTKYRSWQAFSDDLRFATEAVLSVYKVPYASRIGLRYINALNTRSAKVGSFFPEVLDMLRPELTVLLRRKEVQEPDLALTQIRTKQVEGDFTFQFGVVKEEDETGQLLVSFILDFDRYIEGSLDLELDDLLMRCDRYHADVYNAFRWAIAGGKLASFESA